MTTRPQPQAGLVSWRFRPGPRQDFVGLSTAKRALTLEAQAVSTGVQIC